MILFCFENLPGGSGNRYHRLEGYRSAGYPVRRRQPAPVSSCPEPALDGVDGRWQPEHSGTAGVQRKSSLTIGRKKDGLKRERRSANGSILSSGKRKDGGRHSFLGRRRVSSLLSGKGLEADRYPGSAAFFRPPGNGNPWRNRVRHQGRGFLPSLLLHLFLRPRKHRHAKSGEKPLPGLYARSATPPLCPADPAITRSRDGCGNS